MGNDEFIETNPSMLVPAKPKIYHILHMDRLASVIKDDFLWSDAGVQRRGSAGTEIGLSSIKRRRLDKLKLQSHPDLHVGDCVPFYFCPRSVMLFLIHQGNNPELSYKAGQEPVIHLEADLHSTVGWAQDNDRRWAFTSSNAGSRYFEDFADLGQLDKINWDAVGATWWSGGSIDPEIKNRKQAEFLVEESFPWRRVTRIGVHSAVIRDRVLRIMQGARYRPPVVIKPGWYY